MYNSFVVPGDNQSPQLVDTWVRKYVGTRAVMVVRHTIETGVEFSLVEVGLVTTTAPYLFARGFGSFGTHGRRIPATHDTARILIPTPELVRWATGREIWANGKAVNYKRPRDPLAGLLLLKLYDQMKYITAAEDR